MINEKLTLGVVASLLLATHLYSTELEPLIITSFSIETNELSASYSTEIYTKEDIEKSKSTDIYNFLNSQTSVVVSPSFGNTFSQKIDLRGYGIGDGYQNIVVTVNGRRLNNIDMVTQLLSSIPIDSIERIEIIKGSGSVQYGDGANAGAINIITNDKNQNYIKTYLGNDGTKNSALSLGYSNNNLTINAYSDYTSFDGSRKTLSGKYDKNYNKNKYINLTYYPIDDLELRLGRNYSNMNIKYGGSLTLDQYKKNPNIASSLTQQYFSSYVTTAGLTYNLTSKYSLDMNFNDENKLSEFSTGFKSNYDYKSFNTKLNINENNFKIVIGLDGFKGRRLGASDITTKKNKSVYTSLDYYITRNLTLNVGARKEKVKYIYNSNTFNSSSDKSSLNAYNLGINYKLDENSSIFANYNKSYEAPDIDRFFNFGGTFNSFIKPAKVNNYNIGYSNIQKNNKFKFTIYRSDLKNEIYYYDSGNFLTSFNTNIDKSNKYGIELYDKFIVNKDFTLSANYSYTIAKINSEDENNGAYNGKYLPGVSKHNLTLNLTYVYNNFNTILSHTYRSSAYAANDFENNFTQKQESYNSTDISLSYTYSDIELFAKVQNIFDEDNGLWISDDVIYPVNFERTYYAGIKYKF